MGIFDTVGEWIGKLLSLWLEGTFNGLLTLFSKAFLALANDNSDLLNLDIVQNVMTYGKTVAVYLLVLKLIYDLIKIYILNMEGDSEGGNPLSVFRDGSIALILILNVDFVINEIYRFGVNMANDVVFINNFSFDTFVTGVQNDMSDGVVNNSALVELAGIFLVFMFIVLFVLLIIIVIQMAIRKAELIYYQFIAPFISINMSSPNKDLWGILVKSVVTLSVSQALQIVLVFLVFESLKEFPFYTGFFYAIGFAWVALSTPQALKQFVHSTGMGSSVGGMARMAVQTKMMRR